MDIFYIYKIVFYFSFFSNNKIDIISKDIINNLDENYYYKALDNNLSCITIEHTTEPSKILL